MSFCVCVFVYYVTKFFPFDTGQDKFVWFSFSFLWCCGEWGRLELMNFIWICIEISDDCYDNERKTTPFKSFLFPDISTFQSFSFHVVIIMIIIIQRRSVSQII